jgi:hypothetical protein
VNARLVEELAAEARYRRERLALYRARIYGSQPTSADRLRKLEQASDYADQRLRDARGGVGGRPAERPVHSGKSNDQ